MKEEICEKIYDEVFRHITQRGISIFLCGGASSRHEISYRDKLCKELKCISGIDVLYPEDLFMELLNRNRKKYDLLKLEQFLANNSDYIVIVCESPGSFTELGAFVNNDETVSKVIVLLQTKYKNAKSFIRQGPVAYIESKDKRRVVYYNQGDTAKAVKEIKKVVGGWRGSFDRYWNRLDTITGQRDLLLIFLYFQEEMSAGELIEHIKLLYEKERGPIDQFEIFYDAAIRRCFKERQIVKMADGKYQLTERGYWFVMELLSHVYLKKRTKVFNDIRMKIMYNARNE